MEKRYERKDERIYEIETPDPIRVCCCIERIGEREKDASTGLKLNSGRNFWDCWIVLCSFAYEEDAGVVNCWEEKDTGSDRWTSIVYFLLL